MDRFDSRTDYGPSIWLHFGPVQVSRPTVWTIGRLAVVLEREGSDCNAVDDIGMTALCMAAGGGLAEVVETLLQLKTIDLNLGQYRPLSQAARYGHQDVVKLLLEQKDVLEMIQHYSSRWQILLTVAMAM